MAKIKIIGTGIYAPGKPIDNDELQKLTGIELDSAKLENKLGIKQRHMARLRGIKETTADFATKAAINAINNAGINPNDVDAFIVGTDTPEYISPATALIVQGRIQEGERWGAGFDINSSCASFATAYDMAARLMETDPTMKKAVVVGVYNMPAYVRDKDAFGFSIFADGAGAIVLERTTDDDVSGYINGQYMADGTQWNFVGVYSGGTKNPVTHEVLDSGEYGLQLIQPLPGDRNVRLWPMITKKLLEKTNKTVDQIDHIFFTQINRYVIEQVMNILELPMEKTTCVMDRYGYTGSGCIPMAFHHAIQDGKLKRGDTIVFITSGAGFAVGTNIFNY